MEINKQSPYKQIHINEKQNVGETNRGDFNAEAPWLSKQDSRRNFGGDTPKGSIGSALI